MADPKSKGKKTRTKVAQRPGGRWRPKFLETLRESGVVTHSAQVAGVGHRTVYKHREIDPEFAKQWDEAVAEAIERLELEAVRRARDYSDLLLIFLLKANKPDKYRETRRFEVSGPLGGPVEIATPKERAERLATLLDKVHEGGRRTSDD